MAHGVIPTAAFPRTAPKALPARVCLGLSRMFSNGPLARFGFRQGPAAARFASEQNYVADRRGQADSYRRLFAPFCSFRGKTVLDLGCSSGYLVSAFLEHEPFDAIGADLDPEALRLAQETYPQIRFVQSTPAGVPLEPASVDVVYSVDTVEHLSRPREILLDCHRVLRPGGSLLLHFQPWLGPCGSHLEDIIPFPWANALFSMDTLLDVASYLYDSDEYVTACYWNDRRTGARRPNPYLDHARWDEFLNRMTVRRFKLLLRGLPFTTVHLRLIGFGGRRYRAARLLGAFANVPGLNELLTSAVFCVLRKEPGH
jgi:SAM-dependent methyltransferase